MTTAWAHTVRGRLASALTTNAGGTILAVAAVFAAPWLVLSAIAGRWMVVSPNDSALGWAAAAFVAITLVDWAIRLALR